MGEVAVERGLLLSATDLLNVVTRHAYDGFGNLITTTRDAGGLNVIERRSYDAVGNLLALTDPNGSTAISSYDTNRRLLSVTTPAAAGSPALVTATSYDPDGNPTQVQQSASGMVPRTSSRTYTSTEKVATATDADGNVTRYLYDAVDRLASVTDAVGRTMAYTYDALGRQVAVSNPAIQAPPLLST